MSNAQKIAILDKTVYNYIQTKGSSTQLQMSDKRLDNIVLAHKEVYDILYPKMSLRRDLFAHNQLYFCRLLAQEPNIKKRLNQKLREFSLSHVMANAAIWKNNSFKSAVKLIVAKEVGPFLSCLLKWFGKL